MRRWVTVLAALAGAGCAVAGCAASAPADVLQRDTAEVLLRKAKLVARPGPDTVAAALAAKGQFVHDLCCYEAPDAGVALDGAADAAP